MCGIAGEIRFDGHDADVAAVARINEAMHRRGPDGSGVHAMGRAAFGHRRLKILDLSECGAQPMVDNELGLTTVFNGLIYNYRGAQGGAGRATATGSSRPPTPRSWSRPSTGGARRASSASSGMFAFAIVDRDTGVLTLGRDRLGIKPLYYTQNADRLRFASGLPALLEGGEVDTVDRQGRAAPLHELPLGRPGAAHDPQRRPQAAPGDRAHRAARRHVHRPRLLAPRARPAPRVRRDVVGRLARRRAGGAAAGRQAAHGRRRPGRRAALRRPRLVAGRGPARAGGPARAEDVQRRFPRDRQARPGDEFEYSDLVAREFAHRPPADPRRPRPAAPGRRRGDHGDGRADGQPRLRGLLPAVAGGLEVGDGGAVRARARTRCSPATAGTRRWPRCPATRGLDGVREGLHRPPARRAGPHPGARLAARRRPAARLHPRALRDARRRDHARRRAADGLDDHAGRRPREAGRQHDHGLGAGSARPLPRP